MKVYNLSNLPKKFNNQVKLSPRSQQIVVRAKIDLLQLFLKSREEFIKYEGQNYQSDYQQYQKRRQKKLEILIELRQKLIKNGENSKSLNISKKFKNQSNKSSHNLKPVEIHKKEVPPFNSTKNKMTQLQSEQDYGLLNSHRNYKKSSSDQLLKKKSNSLSVKIINKSPNYFKQKNKKIEESENSQEFSNDIKLQHSREIIKLIQKQKLYQKKRQQQMKDKTGIQAKRLSKIHFIQRIQSQKKIEELQRKYKSKNYSNSNLQE